jgi:2-oxo-4-hydroxy-4-carboxy-5-ureidoimidazoline decarboxylase
VPRARAPPRCCELLEARLHNDRATELVNAAIEQGKILRLRLEKLL